MGNREKGLSGSSDGVRKKRRRRKHKWYIPILVILLFLVLSAAAFFGLFTVRSAEVVGNSRYTADEMRGMVFNSFWRKNSLYLAYRVRSIDMREIPFMDSVDIEYLGPGSVRLHVNEDSPIGYVLQGGARYYFNVEGVILESMVDGSQASVPADGKTGESRVDASGGESVVSGSSEGMTAMSQGPGRKESSVSSGSEGASGMAVPSAGGENLRPALTDVPRVTGLTDQAMHVGDRIKTKFEEETFQTILAITRLLSKFELSVDELRLDDGGNYTLLFGETQVRLGRDSRLEDKLTRMTAIYPKIRGQAGTLHLENFSEETKNIIFVPKEVEEAEEESKAVEKTRSSAKSNRVAGGDAGSGQSSETAGDQAGTEDGQTEEGLYQEDSDQGLSEYGMEDSGEQALQDQQTQAGF